jgi:cytochrome P450
MLAVRMNETPAGKRVSTVSSAKRPQAQVEDFPVARGCPYAPPPEYELYRARDTITEVRLPSGQRAWAVSRYEHVCQVLNDDRRFRSARQHPGFPRLSAGAPLRSAPDGITLTRIDGPEHRAARRAVAEEFTGLRVETLRPRLQRIADSLIDAVLSESDATDLVASLAQPFSSQVICEMLGVPEVDRGIFHSANARMMDLSGEVQDRRAAYEQVRDYLDRLVIDKETDLPDDLLGRQIAKLRADGGYRHEDLFALAFILLQAGHESTSNMIGLGVFALLQHPEQLAALRAEPRRILPAVEEMLRYFSISERSAARLCVVDTEIGGVTIRAGEGVLALTYAANRDPAVFHDPDVFDIDRGARHHLAFGFGPHRCLGVHLARMELEVVFNTIFSRMPDLRLAGPADELSFKKEGFYYGLTSLPVTWAG